MRTHKWLERKLQYRSLVPVRLAHTIDEIYALITYLVRIPQQMTPTKYGSVNAFMTLVGGVSDIIDKQDQRLKKLMKER